MIFNELKQIFIFLVEERKVGLLRKVIGQVEPGQTRYSDALLEHVYATLLVEGKLSVKTGVILVGNILVLYSTEECLFQWKSGVVEPLQTFHVLVREMIFRNLASIRFQILVVAEPRGYVIGHI